MQERPYIKITDWIQPTGRSKVNKIWSCKDIFFLVVVLLFGCSNVNKMAKQPEAVGGQISPCLQAAVQRMNELFLQVEGKPRRQFTDSKRMLPYGGSEVSSFWLAPGGMKETRPGMYEVDGVIQRSRILPSGEKKTELLDMVTRFTADRKNSDLVVCYELTRPQGSREDFEVRGAWEVKLMGSDGIWIGHSADVVRRLKPGDWLSNEWRAKPSGEVYGIRQFLGAPSVVVEEIQPVQ